MEVLGAGSVDRIIMEEHCAAALSSRHFSEMNPLSNESPYSQHVPIYSYVAATTTGLVSHLTK